MARFFTYGFMSAPYQNFTPGGQRILADMHDAILIVSGGLLQIPSIQAARDLGLRVVVTDGRRDAPAMTLADEPVVLDIYDVQGHRHLAQELKRRYNLRGVFAQGADVEVTVAAAADAAGLPGIPVESAMNTKNKARMRACFDKAGIPNPAWAEITTLEEAIKVARGIGFPLIVKAVDNCASRGTKRVNAPEFLRSAIEVAKANSTTGTALLEECFGGEEQSVEIMFDHQGDCHFLNIVDRPFQSEGPYAIELGHINPTRLDRASQEQVFRLTEEAAEATGVRFGAFKADTISTRGGPRILEVTARLSGGFDCQYTTPLSTGRNLIRAAMCLAIGRPLDPADLQHKWHRHAAAWAALPKPGRIKRINGVERALAVPGVKEVFLRARLGEVIPPYRDCAARPAFVIAVADTREEAVASAKAGVQALRIETVPSSNKTSADSASNPQSERSRNARPQGRGK
jgi:biotin carboxylase